MNSSVGPRKAVSAQLRRFYTVQAAAAVLTIGGATAAAFLVPASLAQAQNAPADKPAATAPAKKAGSKAAAGAGTATSDKAQTSYSIGVSMGEQLHRAGLTADAVSMEPLMQGVRDSLAGKATVKPEDQQRISNLVRAVRTNLAESNHAAAKAFLAENGKKKDIVTTASGLQYQVINAGDGASPKPTDEVTVNYRGSLLDGTEFDSSYKRGQPATFPVNGVIPGWQEALVLMKPGAKWQLFVPPNLAYDLNSPPAIPPGSLLKFDVELIKVKEQAAAPAAPAAPAVPANPK